MIENGLKKRRVVIYARVSTEHEAQLSALENQVDWYKPILASHPEWELIEQYIDALVTCDDTTAHKPDPEPALIGLGQLRGQEGSGSPEGVLTAEDALFVGDTRFDIDCAHNAGIPAALVAWSATMKKEDPVQTWPAEYYLESPEQLVEILRG